LGIESPPITLPNVRKLYKLLTNGVAAMSHLTESILSAVQALPEGGMVSPKQFLHLASRAAVDQALARMAREGKLLRIGRGSYAVPLDGRFGPRPPSTEAIIAAVEAGSGEIIVASGAAEANALGLTTQMPIREVFLTSGPSRVLHLGNRAVELKHGSRWKLVLGKRPAGMAIRALACLGPDRASSAIGTLQMQLPDEEWRAIQAVRGALPSWMARIVSDNSRCSTRA
jgi:hypothetical protein